MFGFISRNSEEDCFNKILPTAKKAVAATSLAICLAISQPTVTTAAAPPLTHSATAAQIHLNSLPPSTISVKIDDLPFIGGILSGTYRKLDDDSISFMASNPFPVIIKSPEDKVLAVTNAATGGHLEFQVDGVLNSLVNVDVAASKPGIAAIRVESPLIPRLPFRNSASALIPPGVSALKLAHGSKSTITEDAFSHPTAAHISLNSLPPKAISVEIQDLPVLGKALSGVYTKVPDDGSENGASAAVTIESPKDKVAAIKAIASMGHFEFDIDGIVNTHLDVDVATDIPGTATIRVASPLIPVLPFQNAASF